MGGKKKKKTAQRSAGTDGGTWMCPCRCSVATLSQSLNGSASPVTRGSSLLTALADPWGRDWALHRNAKRAERCHLFADQHQIAHGTGSAGLRNRARLFICTRHSPQPLLQLNILVLVKLNNQVFREQKHVLGPFVSNYTGCYWDLGTCKQQVHTCRIPR